MSNKTNHISRRRFVAAAAGGATLAGLGGFPAVAGPFVTKSVSTRITPLWST